MRARHKASGHGLAAMKVLAVGVECVCLAVFGSLLLLGSLALSREPTVRL